MNAIHPEVQDFILNLIEEVLINYEVAGIQGDDRLPAMPSEGGYSTYTKDLYKQSTGLKAYQTLWRISFWNGKPINYLFFC